MDGVNKDVLSLPDSPIMSVIAGIYLVMRLEHILYSALTVKILHVEA